MGRGMPMARPRNNMTNHNHPMKVFEIALEPEAETNARSHTSTRASWWGDVAARWFESASAGVRAYTATDCNKGTIKGWFR